MRENILRLTKLTRDIVVAAVWVMFIIVAVFFTVKNKEVITPPSPTIEYNKKLLSLYIKTNDWQLKHFIESDINLAELDKPEIDIYYGALRENYYKSPDEYSLSILPLDLVNELQTKCYLTIVNHKDFRLPVLPNEVELYIHRSTYLAKQNQNTQDRTLPIQTDKEKILSSISELDFYTQQVAINLQSGDQAKIKLSFEQLDKSIEQYSESINSGELFYYYPYYDKRIYDCFDRFGFDQNVDLYDETQKIFLDVTEDLGLRLRVLEYINDNAYINQNMAEERRLELINALYGLLDTGVKNGYFISDRRYTSEQQTQFQILILSTLEAKLLIGQNKFP